MARSGSFPDSGHYIGAYEIQELLGRGGMGEVFLAWDHRLRRRVAIKRVRSDREISAPSRQRLLREARAVAGLNHPAIVQIYDLIEDESEDCIVLEYVEGKTLAAMLSGGALKPTVAVQLAREIADGLAAAHEVGIIHRDLKPENVIITLAGHAKILDFGLARLQALSSEEDTRLTQDGVLLGTFHMMSPEQVTGGNLDERSDLFSLGVVLYEMLTGQSPFRGVTPQETLRRVLSENPPRVDALCHGLPERLGDLVEDLLAKDPKGRPGSAAEVVHDLEEISTLLNTVATPVPSASVSDLPTVVDIPRSVESLPLIQDLEGSAQEKSLLSRQSSWKIAVALAVLLIGAAIFLQQPKYIRVLVIKPKIDEKDPQLQRAASGVLVSSLDTLGSLEGIVPVDASQLMGSPKSTAEMTRAAAAQEVLLLKIERVGNLGRITLQRIRGSNDKLIWEKTEILPIELQKLLALNGGVSAMVLNGFSDHSQKPGMLTLEASPDDYASLAEVEDLIETGGPSELVEAHKSLEEIVRHAPRFMRARARAVDVAIRLYRLKREATYLHDAKDLVKQAEQLEPSNSLTVVSRFNLELAAMDLPHASETLSRLQELIPDDPQILRLQARLWEAKGQIKEALAFQKEVTKEVPTWQNILILARLEAREGHAQEAKFNLDKIFEDSPNNPWFREQQATIELEYGEPSKARLLYQELIDRSPNPSITCYTNLGNALALLGENEKALIAFKRALTKDPNRLEILLGIADAEAALNHLDEADRYYQKVLQKWTWAQHPGDATVTQDIPLIAQALAHTGQTQQAVELVQAALRQNPDDSTILPTAALVYTLANDRDSALKAIKRAIDKGVGPNWFKLPAFKELSKDPEFKRLINRDTH